MATAKTEQEGGRRLAARIVLAVAVINLLFLLSELTFNVVRAFL